MGGEYSADELAFLAAVQAEQKLCRKKFLSHTDYLKIVVGLGYRKADA